MTCELYRCYSENDDLLYVGISKSSFVRLCDHMYQSGWAGYVARIEVARFENRRIALEKERIAIINEKPLWNIQHNGSNRIREEIIEKLVPANTCNHYEQRCDECSEWGEWYEDEKGGFRFEEFDTILANELIKGFSADDLILEPLKTFYLSSVGRHLDKEFVPVTKHQTVEYFKANFFNCTEWLSGSYMLGWEDLEVAKTHFNHTGSIIRGTLPVGICFDADNRNKIFCFMLNQQENDLYHLTNRYIEDDHSHGEIWAAFFYWMCMTSDSIRVVGINEQGEIVGDWVDNSDDADILSTLFMQFQEGVNLKERIKL